ncbi:MAG: glycoside hydrolase family 2, partial [Defluviitaleaceae bacterium]|nr:glycoside hydrolase family 2 [Defluviitaleaceae bacterium]
GLGKAYLDPYGFVAGGLYNKSNMPLTNGNERGVATLRDGQSHVGFADLDFGDIGADEIHLPIFAMTQEHFPIEVWEGMPEQGGEKITELTYKSGSKWNTYITESYKLPRKLVGITTMCFVVNKKIHIKGFSFTKEEKAYKQLHAADFTKIYGDSYEIEQTKVTGIGNNVTIDFADMNFKKGNAILQINGRGSVNNTIHLKQGDNKSQILEFPKTDDYITKEFEVETVGENTVTFVFLPGSNFDFAWLKFVENRR